MDKTEFERWQAVTGSSRHRWVEDTVTRLNGGEHCIIWAVNPALS